jgi:sigma-B regulation protein RsbU (phosphoserine phosphatase)
MERILSKIREQIPTGLAFKLIRAVVIVIAILGLEFLVVSAGEIHVLEHLVKNEGEELTTKVEEDSQETLDNLVRKSLQDLSVRAADKTDDELWVNEYELTILGGQVADVIAHPDHYGRVPVEPPKKENGGKLSLQLLAPNGYENISPESMATMERLANLESIMATYIGEYTIDCYIGLTDGTTLAIDKLSDRKYDENGEIKSYDATTRPWYQEAVKAGDTYFSPAVHSFFYDYDIVTYSRPVYVDGELVAVLEGALNVDALRERVTYVEFGETGVNVLISSSGQLVSTSRTTGELSMREDPYEDIRGSVNDGLAKLIDDGLAGGSGTAIVEIDGEKYYAGYGPLVTVGWTQIAFSSVEEVTRPARALAGEASASYESMKKEISDTFRLSLIVVVVVMLIILQITIIVLSRQAQKSVAPIDHMTKKISELTGDNMTFEMEDIYKTGDEIELLARSFEDQSAKLSGYMQENIRISAEKERIDAEMAMATQIQDSMLPKLTEAFYDRSEFDLYAMTDPAIDVGGDFYDFFYIDDDHLAIVIADVSGKGVTAALFMALSKQVIQSQMLLHNGDVVEALTDANLRLLEESVKDMFVTVWLGLITLSTGELSFVDAGHEYPAIRKKGGSFVIDKDIHSLSVAAIKKAKFKLNEIRLEPGDTIYLYTDGVTEAHNAAGDMFGMDRLATALNETGDVSPEEIDIQVRNRISEFVGDTEQFDDITTLCLTYHGKQPTLS